jgi:hypothetical protein
MKRLRARLAEVVVFTLLVGACVASAAQVTVRASDPPACAGLACYDGSDCGSKCFCNRPSSTCYSDQLDIE